jgi:acyl transferase domain-containing protein/protein-L-isoaspartate O-methyltransferase
LLANELNERLQAIEYERSEPLAIIGMGCRFPGGANDPESLWTLLHEGVDAIREVPSDRWDVDAFYHPDPDTPGRMATRWGGFIEGPDRFDPKFFGIAPGEAITMDPQQRLLLETTWEALENAGVNPASLAGTATGVFVGVCNSDYAFHVLQAPRESITPYFASGLSHSVAAGRISYLLGLQGPSLTVDTSCSASLMAIHLACQSLRSRESDFALAGGVNVILNPEITIALSRSHMMAPDGRCKPFSEGANGFVRAEGSGIIVLKRLTDALAGRDNILAVIRGTAANQDGKSNGLTAPNGPSQEAVLQAALSNAQLRPDDLQYIEAHGTGTSLGDPIEAGALARVFAERSRELDPLWIGSVKSNIGHLESAAGVAGLMKLVLALQHKEIPATLHLETPSRRIEWDALPIRPVRRRETWPQVNGLRAGGVSSFGFSGTNVHAILQEAPSVEMPTDGNIDAYPTLVMLSAKTGTALLQVANRLAEWLRGHPDLRLPAVARTLSAGRWHFENRLAIVARSCEELIAKLQSFPGGDLATGRQVDSQQLIEFVFASDAASGNSWQALLESVPLFRERFNQCDAILSEQVGSLRALDHWRQVPPFAVPAEIRCALALSVQFAYAGLLQSCGVEPTHISGINSGTIAAACCAGALRIEDGVRLALAIGQNDVRRVEALSQSIPLQGPERPWYCVDTESLLTHFSRRALKSGVALPDSERLNRKNRLSILIGEPEKETIESRQIVSMAGRGSDGLEAFVRTAAELYTLGANPELSKLYGETVSQTVALPTYPFERERYWLEIDRDALPKPSPLSKAPIDPAENSTGLAAPNDWLYEVAWEPQPIRPQTVVEGNTPQLVSVLEDYVAAPASDAVLRIGEASSRLQSVCAALALRSLEELGLRRLPDEPFLINELCDRLQVAPMRRRIVGRFLGMLAEDGLAIRDGERFQIVESRESRDLNAELDRLKEQYPEIETELIILKRCAGHTPAVLRGTCDPMQLVFNEGSVNEAEQIYEKSPVCQYFNAATSEIIRRAVGTIKGRTANILEIGAGTGATTASVLPALAGLSVRYTFTDLSPVFLKKAREKFSSFDGVEYRLLNVERDPATQGFEKGTCDIVLAANVLHATASLRETVAHARQLLRPGGMLMIIEGSRPDRWLELTFGLTDGWWRFADSDLRNEHPLVSIEKWQALFREQGMTANRAVTYTDRADIPSQQVLLGACADLPGTAQSAEKEPRRWLIIDDHNGVGAALKRMLRQRPELGEVTDAGSLELDRIDALASSRGEVSDDELHIVYLGNLNANDAEDGIDLCVKKPVRLIQRLSSNKRLAKLWLVTQGAQAAGARKPTAKSALQAMTWGIGRTLRLEHPDIFGGLIDLDPEGTPEESANDLLREMQHHDVEDQIALRKGERLAPRLRHLKPSELGNTRPRLRPDGSYLVTGAFGGVGQRVVRWLAESGARHLVLVGRRTAGGDGESLTEERARFVQELRTLGASVVLVRDDLASPDGLEEIFRRFGVDYPPLRGILHMATSQKMSELSALSEKDLDEVLGPKVKGGWILSRAARAHQLDFFVSFSSIAAVLGAQNSAAYAAGNHFLDSLASAERAQGCPMISVNWGAWTMPGATKQLRRVGLVPMATEHALGWLPQILGAARAEVMIADMDWNTAKGLYESRRVQPILSELSVERTLKDQAQSRKVETGPTGVGGASIAEVVLSECTRVLGFRNGDRPPLDVPLTELGLDSLMAVDLRNRLQTVVRRDLPSTIVFDYPTVAELTELIETMLWASTGDSAANESSPHDEVRI